MIISAAGPAEFRRSSPNSGEISFGRFAGAIEHRIQTAVLVQKIGVLVFKLAGRFEASERNTEGEFRINV